MDMKKSMVKKSLEHFMKKELQKTNQKEFRIEKVIKRQGNDLMSNSKDMIIHLTAGLIENHMNHLVVTLLVSKLIYQIMQQKQI